MLGIIICGWPAIYTLYAADQLLTHKPDKKIVRHWPNCHPKHLTILLQVLLLM